MQPSHVSSGTAVIRTGGISHGVGHLVEAAKGIELIADGLLNCLARAAMQDRRHSGRTMEYTVVFDVTQHWYHHWQLPAFGLTFVVIGTGLVLERRRLPARIPSFFPFVFLAFAVMWTFFALVPTAKSFALASAFLNGRCEVTEGIVSEFHPMPFGGHEMEWFVVGGKRFKYSDYVLTGGFNNTASHGGPIHKGIQVRVHHIGNDIAKLEVAR